MVSEMGNGLTVYGWIIVLSACRPETAVIADARGDIKARARRHTNPPGDVSDVSLAQRQPGQAGFSSSRKPLGLRMNRLPTARYVSVRIAR